jgi:hypothetical protein
MVDFYMSDAGPLDSATIVFVIRTLIEADVGELFCVGSGAETPTSEPGLCATDMWDSDWDEDPEDFYVYRHQVQCNQFCKMCQICNVVS